LLARRQIVGDSKDSIVKSVKRFSYSFELSVVVLANICFFYLKQAFVPLFY
jgi:hypothetical protein